MFTYSIEKEFEQLQWHQSGQYHLVCKQDTNLVVEYVAEDTLDISLEVDVWQDAKVTILFINHAQTSVQTNEVYYVKKDASLHVAYCELTLQAIVHKTKVYLQETGANANVHTATVCGNAIHYDIFIQHTSPYTQGHMENYGIVMKHGKWDIVATGQISKGCYQSKSHQITRILTLDDKQTVKVLPILLIDENDVEASHANSLGQPDENQLYYMQSRGMSRAQAIQLLTIGYLLPIVNVIEDERIREQLRDEIEKKVQLCQI